MQVAGDGAGCEELVRGVRVALGERGVEVGTAADRNADGAVGIDAPITAVNAALAGC